MDFSVGPEIQKTRARFRLVDGATDGHQQALARHFMEERGDFWRWS